MRVQYPDAINHHPEAGRDLVVISLVMTWRCRVSLGSSLGSGVPRGPHVIGMRRGLVWPLPMEGRDELDRPGRGRAAMCAQLSVEDQAWGMGPRVQDYTIWYNSSLVSNSRRTSRRE